MAIKQSAQKAIDVGSQDDKRIKFGFDHRVTHDDTDVNDPIWLAVAPTIICEEDKHEEDKHEEDNL